MTVAADENGRHLSLALSGTARFEIDSRGVYCAPEGGTDFLLRREPPLLTEFTRGKAADKNDASGQGRSAKCFVFYGERGRNRTFNLLIKSQLLCQLSYAPFTGWTSTFIA